LAYVATLRAAGNLSFELAQILWIAIGRVNIMVSNQQGMC